MRSFLVFLSFIWGSQLALAGASTVFGKTEWKLTVFAEDEVLLKDLRQNSYIPWCFDSLKGRGKLKDLSLSLHWDQAGRPSLSLGKDELQTHQEDRGIISCLDASLKEFPPHHARADDLLRFEFIRSRK